MDRMLQWKAMGSERQTQNNPIGAHSWCSLMSAASSATRQSRRILGSHPVWDIAWGRVKLLFQMVIWLHSINPHGWWFGEALNSAPVVHPCFGIIYNAYYSGMEAVGRWETYAILAIWRLFWCTLISAPRRSTGRLRTSIDPHSVLDIATERVILLSASVDELETVRPRPDAIEVDSTQTQVHMIHVNDVE